MKEIVIRIIVFTLLLNFSVGLMIYLVPGFDSALNRGGIEQKDYNDIVSLTEDFNASINIDSVQEEGRSVDQLWGLSTLKKIGSIINAIPDYLFGFVKVMENFFGGYMEPAVANYLFNGMYTILTLMYAFLVFSLFSGRNL